MADGLLSGLYKAAIPVNARMLLEQFQGNKFPITEKDFSDEELAALRRAIQATQQRNIDEESFYRANLQKTKKEYEKNPETQLVLSPVEGSPNRKVSVPIPYKDWLNQQKKAVKSYEKTRDKTSFTYGAYDVKSGDTAAPIGQNWLEAIYQSYTDPAFRMASTLGSANYYNKKGQTPYVQDTYGFELHPEAYKKDPSKMSTLEVIQNFGVTSPATMFEILAARFAPQRRPVQISLPQQEPVNVTYQDPFTSTIK